MTIRFEKATDFRKPDCEHAQVDGCWRCCSYCNHVRHRCGGCGDPTDHQNSTCSECYRLYFTDEEE